jgi:hypothetical protein
MAARGEKRKRGDGERIDYMEEIGQARAKVKVQKWFSGHEGIDLAREELNAYTAEGKEIEKNTDQATLHNTALHRDHKTNKYTSEKWSLNMDTGCWLLHSGLSSGGKANYEGVRYGFAKLPTNQQLQNKANGIPVPRHKEINVSFHTLAYLAEHGENIVGSSSHLCGRSTCFNPDHIVDESQAKNLSRRGCLGKIWCPIHEVVVLDLCEHDPKCITPMFRDDPRLQPACCGGHGSAASPSARSGFFQRPTSSQAVAASIPSSQLYSPSLLYSSSPSLHSNVGGIHAHPPRPRTSGITQTTLDSFLGRGPN